MADCMKIAIISDIHANQEALAAVLAAIGGVERILCCGDVVGYYDRPNAMCDMRPGHRRLAVSKHHGPTERRVRRHSPVRKARVEAA